MYPRGPPAPLAAWGVGRQQAGAGVGVGVGAAGGGAGPRLEPAAASHASSPRSSSRLGPHHSAQGPRGGSEGGREGAGAGQIPRLWDFTVAKHQNFFWRGFDGEWTLTLTECFPGNDVLPLQPFDMDLPLGISCQKVFGHGKRSRGDFQLSPVTPVISQVLCWLPHPPGTWTGLGPGHGWQPNWGANLRPRMAAWEDVEVWGRPTEENFFGAEGNF